MLIYIILFFISGLIKMRDIKSGKLVESEDLYVISSKSDFDVSFSYDDLETESKVTIYLKKSLA